MKKFVLRILQNPWFFPLALLLVGLVAYAFILPSLGFYWDDWEGVYLYYMHNPAISFQYYTFRPLSALIYLLVFPLTKMTPLVWQIVALVLRWLGVLFIYFTLNRVWPSRRQLNRWVAVILFVFPGFLDQPVAVTFSRHFTTYLFFAASLFLTVLALKQRKLFWLWMPLSVLLGGLQIFTLEYFVGLEVVRPILIWVVLRSGPTEKRVRLFWKTLLYWSPFILVLIGYAYWRFSYLPATLGADPNNPVFLKTLLASPRTGLPAMVGLVYQDILQLLLYVWPKAFLDLATMDIATRRVWVTWIVAAVTAVAFAFYNQKARDAAPDGDDHASRQLLFLGLVIILLGAAPVWAKGDQIADGMWSDRFSLAPMLGAIILIVTLVDWLFRTDRQKQVFFSILLGISISGQMFNQIVFRDDWKAQQQLYWQLHWRIPSLQPGTALYGKGTFTGKSSYYDGIYTVNLLFDSLARPDPQYAFFDIFHAPLADDVPGIPLVQKFRGVTFSGSTSRALVFDFGVRAGCVRVLDSIYNGDPDLNSSVADLFGISDVSTIRATPDLPPNPDIFGPEPPHAWCYYFEKADLARQMQDWNTVLQLKAEVDAGGFTPDIGAEYLPFIEAYAQTGHWQQAYNLSLSAHAIGAGPGMALCNAWQGFSHLQSSPSMLSYTGQAIQAFCPSGTP